MNYLKVENVEAYNIAFNFINEVWHIVIQWPYLAQKTFGAQFIDAADSISANIAKALDVITKRIKLNFTIIKEDHH